MSQNVKVTSIAALGEFRNALATFGEDAKSAIGNTEMEVRRATDWLVRGQAMFWTAEIKKSQQAVAEAQAALFRRKISQQGGTVNDAEQKEALRNAKRRLTNAEEKLKVVKKWIPVLQHAVAEYHARVHPLGDMAGGELKHAMFLLDNMVAALDAYTKINPPPRMAAAAPGGGSGAAKSAGTAAGTPETAAAGTPEAAPVPVPLAGSGGADGESTPAPVGAPEPGEPIAVEGS